MIRPLIVSGRNDRGHVLEHGVHITSGIGYRVNKTSGTPTGDEAETIHFGTSASRALGDGGSGKWPLGWIGEDQ
jgi:hypothetical protein